MSTIDPDWPNDEKILDLGCDDLAVRLYFSAIADSDMCSDGTCRPTSARKIRSKWLSESGRDLEVIQASWDHVFKVGLLVTYTADGYFFAPGYLNHTGRLDRAVRAGRNPEIPKDVLDRHHKFAQKYKSLKPGRHTDAYMRTSKSISKHANITEVSSAQGIEMPGISGMIRDDPGTSGIVPDHPGNSPSGTGTGTGTGLVQGLAAGDAAAKNISPIHVLHLSESEKMASEPRGKTSRKRAASELPFADDFAAAWDLYPRKLGRRAAHVAYVARRRAGIEAADLLAAVHGYRAHVVQAGTEPQYVLHGSTFFGPKNRWQDYQNGVPIESVAATPEEQQAAARAALLSWTGR